MTAPAAEQDEFRRRLCGERMAVAAPVIAATLPCRFGCKAPAVAIVHFPGTRAAFLDPLQALCREHVEGAGNEGRVVAWLEGEAT